MNGRVRVDQTIFATDPKRLGNCVAACVATIVNEPLDRVPNFVEFGVAYGDSDDKGDPAPGRHWWAMLHGYLAAKGFWTYAVKKPTDADVDELVLVAGKSNRGVMHQVIYRSGRLWHDPHPSRDGVLDVQEALVVRPLPGFDHDPTEPEEVAS